MKRAFFILGAEGAGTRCLTAAFVAAGCRGSAEHQQPMDDLDFSGEGDLVFRRSLPHGGEWPDLTTISQAMIAAEYYVFPVFIHRKTDYVVAHQLRTDREHNGVVQAPYASTQEEAMDHIRCSWVEAYAFALGLCRPLLTVSYEAFVFSPHVRAAFFATLVLGQPLYPLFYNANEHPRYADVRALPW